MNGYSSEVTEHDGNDSVKKANSDSTPMEAESKSRNGYESPNREKRYGTMQCYIEHMQKGLQNVT